MKTMVRQAVSCSPWRRLWWSQSPLVAHGGPGWSKSPSAAHGGPWWSQSPLVARGGPGWSKSPSAAHGGPTVEQISICSPWRSTVEQISTCSPWRTPHQSRGMTKGGCDLVRSPRWSRLLPGPVAPWREKPTPEQGKSVRRKEQQSQRVMD